MCMKFDAQIRRQFKKKAKDNIRRGFWSAMLAVILVIIPTLLISYIYQIQMDQFTPLLENDSLEITQMYTLLRGVYQILGLYVLADVLILEPLKFGLKHYMVARARGEYGSIGLVMCCFASIKKYITAVKLALCIMIRSLGWFVLLGISISALTVAVSAVPMSVVIAVPLMIAVVLYVALKIRRYDGAYICMINVPDGSVWRATNACATIFNGYLWELLFFDLSFLLWYLFGFVTLGIGLIYVVAYHETAFINYFDARTSERARQLQPKPEAQDGTER